MFPVSSYFEIKSIRRIWRSSLLNGVAIKASMIALQSAIECIRPPIATTFALLCSLPSFAVSILQASAARTPYTLFAAICSPLPDPPRTIPSDVGSLAAATAAGIQKTG